MNQYLKWRKKKLAEMDPDEDLAEVLQKLRDEGKMSETLADDELKAQGFIDEGKGVWTKHNAEGGLEAEFIRTSGNLRKRAGRDFMFEFVDHDDPEAVDWKNCPIEDM